MSGQHNNLLSELLRPKKLTDLMLPDNDIIRLQKMIITGNVSNLLFYGSPGRRKTSAARILLCEMKRTLGADTYELNGSQVSSNKQMEKQITDIAQIRTLFLKPKIFLIDEAECLPKRIQHSMRHIVENSSATCRFILTANNYNRIIPEIHSRFMSLNFDLAIRKTNKIIDSLRLQIPAKLTELGITFDLDRVHQILQIHFPDMRAVINKIEYEFGYN